MKNLIILIFNLFIFNSIQSQVLVTYSKTQIKIPFNGIGAITSDNNNIITVVSEDGYKYVNIDSRTGKFGEVMSVSKMGKKGGCPFNRVGAITYDPKLYQLIVFNYSGDKYANYSLRNNTWGSINNLSIFGKGGSPFKAISAIYSDNKNYFYLFSKEEGLYVSWHIKKKVWGKTYPLSILGNGKYPYTKVDAATRYFKTEKFFFIDNNQPYITVLNHSIKKPDSGPSITILIE